MLILSGLAASKPAPAEEPDDWQTFAYWTYNVHRSSRNAPSTQRGVFGLSLSGIGSSERIEAHGSFREEYSKSTDRTRIASEGGYWSCALENLHYRDPDGNIVSAGNDMSRGGRFALQGDIQYFTDPATKQAMISVTLAVQDKDARFPFQYHPLEIDGLKVRVAAKLTDAEHRVHVGGFKQTVPFKTKQPLALQQHLSHPSGEETWFVQRFGKETTHLVVLPEKYKTWMPRGEKDERTPGNYILVRAQLQGFRGQPPLVKAKWIQFRLEDVSQEPGIALNWPPPRHVIRPAPPDLQIDQQVNRHLLITDDLHQQMAITREGVCTESYVIISTYDWGAAGALQVRAELTDGTFLVGRLYTDAAGEVYDASWGDDDDSGLSWDIEAHTRVLLPKRNPQSHIADEWRRILRVPDGVPDNNDSENDPVGDGFRGDGLTLYEEYRGFYEDGRHIEGNVRVKDLFVRRETRSLTVKQGVAIFASASGLRVHGDLNGDELPMDRSRSSEYRVINCNAAWAHLVDQHGLIILKESPGFKGGEAASFGPPRNVAWIKIDPSVARLFAHRDDTKVVAHELGHGVGMRHHGDRDIGTVRWEAGKLDNGRPVIVETAYQMDGTTVDSSGYHGPVRVFSGNREIDPASSWSHFTGLHWVAREHGQHSGVGGCLMCYNIADAIERPPMPLRVRAHVTPPTTSLYFCSSINGPPPFGDADQNGGDGRKSRGNCAAQICVNDRLTTD